MGWEHIDLPQMASKTFLRVHREGQGKDGNKKPVLFPKLVFLYTEELHGKGKVNEDLLKKVLKLPRKQCILIG